MILKDTKVWGLPSANAITDIAPKLSEAQIVFSETAQQELPSDLARVRMYVKEGSIFKKKERLLNPFNVDDREIIFNRRPDLRDLYKKWVKEHAVAGRWTEGQTSKTQRRVERLDAILLLVDAQISLDAKNPFLDSRERQKLKDDRDKIFSRLQELKRGERTDITDPIEEYQVEEVPAQVQIPQNGHGAASTETLTNLSGNNGRPEVQTNSAIEALLSVPDTQTSSVLATPHPVFDEPAPQTPILVPTNEVAPPTPVTTVRGDAPLTLGTMDTVTFDRPPVTKPPIDIPSVASENGRKKNVIMINAEPINSNWPPKAAPTVVGMQPIEAMNTQVAPAQQQQEKVSPYRAPGTVSSDEIAKLPPHVQAYIRELQARSTAAQTRAERKGQPTLIKKPEQGTARELYKTIQQERFNRRQNSDVLGAFLKKIKDGINAAVQAYAQVESRVVATTAVLPEVADKVIYESASLAAKVASGSAAIPIGIPGYLAEGAVNGLETFQRSLQSGADRSIATEALRRTVESTEKMMAGLAVGAKDAMRALNRDINGLLVPDSVHDTILSTVDEKTRRISAAEPLAVRKTRMIRKLSSKNDLLTNRNENLSHVNDRLAEGVQRLAKENTVLQQRLRLSQIERTMDALRNIAGGNEQAEKMLEKLVQGDYATVIKDLLSNPSAMEDEDLAQAVRATAAALERTYGIKMRTPEQGVPTELGVDKEIVIATERMHTALDEFNATVKMRQEGHATWQDTSAASDVLNNVHINLAGAFSNKPLPPADHLQEINQLEQEASRVQRIERHKDRLTSIITSTESLSSFINRTILEGNDDEVNRCLDQLDLVEFPSFTQRVKAIEASMLIGSQSTDAELTELFRYVSDVSKKDLEQARFKLIDYLAPESALGATT